MNGDSDRQHRHRATDRHPGALMQRPATLRTATAQIDVSEQS
jgi:hypothetical protein